MQNKISPSIWTMLKTQFSRLKYWNIFIFIKMSIWEIYYWLISRRSQIKYLFAIDDLNNEVKSEDETLFYSPAPFLFLRQSFNFIKKEIKGKIFIDAGCGAGRVLLHAMDYPFSKIYGVDMSKYLTDIAQDNVNKYRKCRKKQMPEVEVIQSDILKFKIPDEPLVLFLFDPFNDEITEKFIDKLVKENKKEIHVIYLSPHKKEMFKSKGFKTICSKANKYGRGFVVMNKK
ncbi:MAG: class I SAM-dependent methyltransferase [Spirochaetes bacterium]|nr:class I SAM-dependent methyltransferase [Spirochaetota bacterium]